MFLSTDTSLWDPSTKATWGGLDFCPVVTQFQVCTIMQRQLTTPSQVGAWGDAEKPQQDMAFVLIAPSLVTRYDWVFGLTAMWVHPCHACLHTLAEVAWNLMWLTNKGTNWPYAYTWMNDAIAHVPLCSEGHIGIMTEGLPSMNACGCLNQLQVWRLLQCGGQVVCPEGLNGSLKALLFDLENYHSGMQPTRMNPSNICP